MFQTFHCLGERYCPAMGKNVAVETHFRADGKADICLMSTQCPHDPSRCLIARKPKQK